MSHKKGFTPLETPSTNINESLNIPRVAVRKSLTGFTLLEILLVVGIIAILAGIVILAINPARQLALARNTQRKSDLKQIYNAINQYYIENSTYPASSTPSTLTEICDTGATTTPHSIACGSLIDLSILVPTYLTAIPKDPSGASSTLTFIPTAYAATNGTGYKIMTDVTNRLIITAPLAELGTSIAIGTTLASGCTAAGGTISTTTGYKIHTFTTVGTSTFTVTSGSCNAEILVVAGGGGGGRTDGGGGGGGGAGGLIYNSSYIVSSGGYIVTVGGGGAGSTANGFRGGNGATSSFGTLIAFGGGGGGAWTAQLDGASGGSGGGGSWTGNAGLGTNGQGNYGGIATGPRGQPAGSDGGGGGGGAGAVGGNGNDATGGAGNGGVGLAYSISGSSVYYAGGGGGGAGTPGGTGGNGGGGNGAVNWYQSGANGLSNTGGGGGGGPTYGTGYNGGSGGSGIVIVRYAI